MPREPIYEMGGVTPVAWIIDEPHDLTKTCLHDVEVVMGHSVGGDSLPMMFCDGCMTASEVPATWHINPNQIVSAVAKN